jgi:hypothetical protein
MALKKSVTTPHGFAADGAYHRVESVKLVAKDRIEFHVRSYLSQDKPFFAESVTSCPYVLESQNPIRQAYIYLKSTDEFSGAEDC